MPLGLLDLSIVTDRLIEQLKDCTKSTRIWDTDPGAKFTIWYTGLAPDAARLVDDQGDCNVSVYLFHVAADKFYRNTYPTEGPPQTIPEQPLALTLYYVLTAYSKASSRQEQQAMSIALKCLHEHPIVNAAVPVGRKREFTVTIEPQTVDDIGRLWQSINSPMRLSAVYRASVIFMEPPAPIAPKVVRHEPSFDKPHEIEPFDTVPVAVVADATVDETGFVAITLDHAHLAAGVTTVVLRALPLVETMVPNVPLVARHFRIVGPGTLHLRVPLYTPQGQYLVTVRPGADAQARNVQLLVPEAIVTVRAEVPGVVTTIAIDDARFVKGEATVTFQAVLLVDTTPNPPLEGQFRVVDDDTLELQLPAPASPGRHRLSVLPALGRPPLEMWLVVP